MLIEKLFKRDIARPINGVVMADQLDDASVWQELDEYVVTKELDKHFRQFFSSYRDAIQQAGNPEVAGKIGIWISGFFGSGKSHFLKVLSYLLENRAVTNNRQAKHAIEFFESKIVDPMLFGDMKTAVSTPTDVVLFNIDTKADTSKGRDAVLRVFLKVFNEMQGYSGDHPHIANMERYLDQKGKLDQFKANFKSVAGEDWTQERDAYQFRQDELVKALSSALDQDEAATKKWVDKAEADLSLTIENLAKWVKEYLDRKGPKHRIIFLVDEIGQFIGGDTHLMLNLQTITENLGTVCGGRAWVVVTAQEDIDAVLGEFKTSKANDFSKIQGRFRTRLSLSSANVDEVIQARLLDKEEPATKELTTLFEDKQDIIKNQLSFYNLGMTFKSFKGPDDFAANYPFAPYQFQLVQKIFETIRKAGATGLHLARGERSMLDAFQSAAIQLSKAEIGVLVPLYRFYPTIDSFLDTAVKKTIDHAKENTSLEALDVEILRTLFLIRYVDGIKGNVENLATLCVDRIDADKLALKKEIEGSVQRLEKETLIGRNGDDFFFLTNEERDIGREIKEIELASGDETRLLGELIFDDVLKGQKKHRYAFNNKDFAFKRMCDLHVVGTKLDTELCVSVISPFADDYELYQPAKCVSQSTDDNGHVLIRLRDNDALGREVRTYLQTEKYVSKKNDGTLAHTTSRILRDRIEENRERRERLTELVRTMLVEADYYADGQSLSLKGSSASQLLADALNYLVENTFSKLSYIKSFCVDCPKEIRQVLLANDVGQQALALKGSEANPQAVDEIRTFVDLSTKSNKKMILREVVDKFGRRPCGWPEWEVLLLLARLAVIGEVKFIYEGSTLALEKAWDTLNTPSRWAKVTVLQRKTTAPKAILDARELGQQVFAEMGPDNEDELHRFLVAKLSAWQKTLQSIKPLADTGKYPGQTEIDNSLKTVAKLLANQESFDFIEDFNAKKDALLDLSEDYHELDNFYTHQKHAWVKLGQAYEDFKLNRSDLDKDADAAAAIIEIEKVLGALAPYNMLAKSESLIETVRAVNQALIAERRQAAIEKIDAGIAEVEHELKSAKGDEPLKKDCLHPLETSRKQVESQTSIAHILQAQQDAVAAVDKAFAKIEAFQKAQQVVKVPVKPRTVIEPAKLVKKTYLETADDVDEFIAELRGKLDEAIKKQHRIQVR